MNSRTSSNKPKEENREPQFSNSGVFSKLGLQNDEGKIDSSATVNGYTYTVIPMGRFGVRTAKQKVERVIGSDADRPKFTPDVFDRTRERMQLMEKKERQQTLEALGLLYSDCVAKHFVENKTVDHASFEKLLHPRHLSGYWDLMKTLQVPRHIPFWRQESFSTLENIARLPLTSLDYEKEGHFPFEDWYSLFWGHYHAFNVPAYLSMITKQNVFLSREFVDAFADYLNFRLEEIGKLHATADIKAPIVVLGGKTANLAGHLNASKKVRVPIIACNEKPNLNPYLMTIPPQKQEEFTPFPMQHLKMNQAIEKYQPCLVLLTELEPNKDETSVLRGYGCIREYIHVGMSESYLEGHGWDTWGNARWRNREDNKAVPAYVEGGWRKLSLPHLSRWLAHKYDSDLAKGFGTVTSFVRAPLLPTMSQQLPWMWKRLLTRY